MPLFMEKINMKGYVYNYYKLQVTWLFHVLFWFYYFIDIMVAKIIDSYNWGFFHFFEYFCQREEISFEFFFQIIC